MTAPLGVPIELGGKSRVLRYTTRALARVEQETGLTVAQVGHRLAIGSLNVTITMVWAGLIHEDPNLTRDQAIDLVELSALDTIGEAVARALAIAVGEDPDKMVAAIQGKGPVVGKAEGTSPPIES